MSRTPNADQLIVVGNAARLDPFVRWFDQAVFVDAIKLGPIARALLRKFECGQ